MRSAEPEAGATNRATTAVSSAALSREQLRGEDDAGRGDDANAEEAVVGRQDVRPVVPRVHPPLHHRRRQFGRAGGPSFTM